MSAPKKDNKSADKDHSRISNRDKVRNFENDLNRGVNQNSQSVTFAESTMNKNLLRALLFYHNSINDRY